VKSSVRVHRRVALPASGAAGSTSGLGARMQRAAASFDHEQSSSGATLARPKPPKG